MSRKKGTLMLLLTVIIAVAGIYAATRLLGSQFDRANDDGTSGKTVEEMLGDSGLQTVTYKGDTYVPRKNIESFLLMGVDHEGDVQQYGNYGGGQADALLLVVVDRDSKEYTILQINRDTICTVELLDMNGQPTGELTQMQIAMAHAVGTGVEDSCENTVRAVSKLLYAVPVDGYAALNMDAMALLNDIVGGVTVTIEDDFSGYDDSLKMGETITLDGQQAYHYLRGRMSVGDGANTSRMRRQRTYMTEFLKKAQRQLADDKNMANTLYNELTPYMVTDLSGNDVSTLLETSQYYSSRGIITPEGTVKRGGTFVEFYADEAALKELVLSLYYEKK